MMPIPFWGKAMRGFWILGATTGRCWVFIPRVSRNSAWTPSDVAQEIGKDVTVVQDIFPSTELIARLGTDKGGHRHLDCDVLRFGRSDSILARHQASFVAAGDLDF